MITDTYATPTPTLSASISNTNVIVNGNQVINSENKTTEIPLRLTVNTNNRTGYTATISSDSNNTALVNAGSTVLAKIDSISAPSTLASLPSNTWGYKKWLILQVIVPSQLYLRLSVFVKLTKQHPVQALAI